MTATELLHSAGSGDVAALTKLLDAGSDPDLAHPATGATPLYNACAASQLEVVRLLLARGADPNRRITYRSPVDGRVEMGVVALMLCSSVAIVELLLASGADARARQDDGSTILMRLVGLAPPAVFERLMRAGADPAARSNAGLTAADCVRKKLAWWRQFAPDKDPEHQAELALMLNMLEGGRSR
jgi:ankyrin repeat protein